MYIWGKAAGAWHALARHDPAYRFKERVSESLTKQARKKNPDAPEVMVRLPDGVDGPGTGTTLCGLEKLALDELGVDPETVDPLCPACVARQ